jgi:ribose transport system permease protein
MTAYRGVAKIIADETTVRPPIASVPEWLRVLSNPVNRQMPWLIDERIPNFSHGVWLALALAAITAIVLNYTVFGRRVFAIGSNEATARLCGVNVPLTKIVVYALGGLFVGIAGVYQFAKLSAGNPTSGDGLELRIIAAVVIGGGSLSGGRGSVLGMLAGAMMMNVIDNGCTMLGLRNPIQDILIGAIIIGAVSVDQWRQGKLFHRVSAWFGRLRGE